LKGIKSKPHPVHKPDTDHGWSPFIFESIAYNGLAYFLLANLLTGAVNFSLQTMHVEPLPAVLIISGYVLLLHVVAFALFKKRFRLKFW
jgi:hypothetical protein